MKTGFNVVFLAALMIIPLEVSALNISVEKKEYYPGDLISIKVGTYNPDLAAGNYVVECVLRKEGSSFVTKAFAKRITIKAGEGGSTNFTFLVQDNQPSDRYIIEAKLWDSSHMIENATIDLFIHGKETDQAQQNTNAESVSSQNKVSTTIDTYVFSVVVVLLFATGTFTAVMLIKYRKLARDKNKLEEELDAQKTKEKVTDLGLNLIKAENAIIRKEEKKLEKDLQTIEKEWNTIESSENAWEQQEERLIDEEINEPELKREAALAARIETGAYSTIVPKYADKKRLERDVAGIKKQISELEALKTVRDDYMQRIRENKLKIDHELRELEKEKEILKKEIEAIYRDPEEVRKAEVRTAAYHRRIERERARLREEKRKIEDEEKKVEEERKKMEKDLREIRLLWDDLQNEIGGGKEEDDGD